MKRSDEARRLDKLYDRLHSKDERIKELEAEIKQARGVAFCWQQTAQERREKQEELQERIKELEAENKQLLELSENLNEHPEGYNGPCLCQLCKSYG